MRCDLKEFGFEEGKHEQFYDQTIWRARIAALPTYISLVIVLYSPAGDAALFRVVRSYHEVILTPVRSRSSADQQDPAFLDVRKFALDLLLDVLECPTCDVP